MIKELDVILSYTTPVGDCLNWARCLNSDGYPRAYIDGDSNAKVHRVVFELYNGRPAEVVRHVCDNPICINPLHLVGGTPEGNVRDRVERGRCYNQVSSQESGDIRMLRARGYSHLKIASLLDIRVKRVEYVLNKQKQAMLVGG